MADVCRTSGLPLQEVDLYKYIRLLPRHTEKLAPEGGLATKGGSLNFRVQCVKYCILHPNLVQKVRTCLSFAYAPRRL
jgi:hypothetical protein